MNLDCFISMDSQIGWGKVYNLSEFLEHFGGCPVQILSLNHTQCSVQIYVLFYVLLHLSESWLILLFLSIFNKVLYDNLYFTFCTFYIITVVYCSTSPVSASKIRSKVFFYRRLSQSHRDLIICLNIHEHHTNPLKQAGSYMGALHCSSQSTITVQDKPLGFNKDKQSLNSYNFEDISLHYDNNCATCSTQPTIFSMIKSN